MKPGSFAYLSKAVCFFLLTAFSNNLFAQYITTAEALARPSNQIVIISGSTYQDNNGSYEYTYDARGWSTSTTQIYPVKIGNTTPGTRQVWVGGEVHGPSPLSTTWKDMKAYYDGTAMLIRSNDYMVVDGLRTDNVMDAVRPRSNSSTFSIRNVHSTYTRDDAVENDEIMGGIIDDCLFDGCYMFLSQQSSTATWSTTDSLKVRNTLVRLEPMPYSTDVGGSAPAFQSEYGVNADRHAQLFKHHGLGDAPVVVENCIFYMPQKSVNGLSSMAFPTFAGCRYSNCILLWTGGGSYPGALPASGVTEYNLNNRTQQQIDQIWDNAMNDWISRHSACTDPPTAYAGTDGEMSASESSYTIEAAKGVAVTNNTGLEWTTSGTGTFTDPNILMAVYTPSTADREAGSVTLSLEATGSGSCPSATDDMILTITPVSNPVSTDPVITDLLHMRVYNERAIEISNPGSQPLDLSNYMIVAGTGSNSADLITGNGVLYNDRFLRYVPGYTYQTEALWASSPNTLVREEVVNPVIEPGGSFVLARVRNAAWFGADYANHYDVLITNEGYGTVDEVATNTKAYYLPVGVTNYVTYWLYSSGQLCLYKIKNDSIKAGLKPVTDPDDFELVDMIGNWNGSKWAPGGVEIPWNEHRMERKSQYWKGNPLSGSTGSFGTSEEESEWIVTQIDWTSAAAAMTSGAIGYHYFDPIQDTICIDPPTANAGADGEVCASEESYTIEAGSGVVVSNNSGLEWTTSGTGAFTDRNVLLAEYTPSEADKAAGSMTLTLEVTSSGNCSTVTDEMLLTITLATDANAGTDGEVSASEESYIIESGSGVSVSNNTGLEWTTSGTGAFTDPNVLLAEYTPSEADKVAGSVILTLEATGSGSCPSATDDMQLIITPVAAPVSVGPVITDLLHMRVYNERAIEISNPGSQPLDLSNYMIVAGTGSNSADLITGNSVLYNDRFLRYVPGYTYQTEALWASSPNTLVREEVVNPVIEPGGSFVLARVRNAAWFGADYANHYDVLITNEGYGTVDEVATNTKAYYLPVGVTNYVTYWLYSSGQLCLYKIKNDSIKAGLKPVTDPDDFELVDMIGNWNGSKWAPGGVEIPWNEHRMERKSQYWKGNPLSGSTGSFGTSEEESEWIVTQIDWTSAAAAMTSGAIGYHYFDPIPDSVCIDPPTADAGADGEMSASDATYTIEAAGGASVTNNLALEWTTSGTGTFTDPNILLAEYTPSTADIEAGSVTLSLEAMGSGSCPSATDSMILTITPQIDPLITDLLHMRVYNERAIEISNPGSTPLDLRDYMIVAGTASSSAELIAGNSVLYNDRFTRYVPGYTYQTEALWASSPNTLVREDVVNPVIEPGGSFVLARVRNAAWFGADFANHYDVLITNEGYGTVDEEATNTKAYYLPSGVTNYVTYWLYSSGQLCLYKIKNDSIKAGLKPVTDPNDFELIDMLGDWTGAKWAPGGVEIPWNEHRMERKSQYWKGNPLPGSTGSFGTTEEESEWNVTQIDWTSAETIMTSGAIGYHYFDSIQDSVYMSNYSGSDNTTSIDQFSIDEINIYPNPSSDRIFIKGAGINSHIVIKNISGQTVKLIEYEEIVYGSVSLGELPPGIYLIYAVSRNSYSRPVKLIKL